MKWGLPAVWYELRLVNLSSQLSCPNMLIMIMYQWVCVMFKFTYGQVSHPRQNMGLNRQYAVASGWRCRPWTKMSHLVGAFVACHSPILSSLFLSLYCQLCNEGIYDDNLLIVSASYQTLTAGAEYCRWLIETNTTGWVWWSWIVLIEPLIN